MKCRDCENRCKCCASHFHDKYPMCMSCEQNYDEFQPADHIKFCPLTGSEIILEEARNYEVL